MSFAHVSHILDTRLYGYHFCSLGAKTTKKLKDQLRISSQLRYTITPHFISLFFRLMLKYEKNSEKILLI